MYDENERWREIRQRRHAMETVPQTSGRNGETICCRR